MFRGGIVAAGGCLVVLALTAGPAFATTDRLDYADQANPICKASNKQIEDLYEATEAEIDRLYDVRAKNRKQARRLRKRAEQLEEQLPFQIVALYKAELDSLKALAAPPGYESTVAAWLGTRQRIATLYDQYLQVEQELENGFGNFRGKSKKAIKRLQKREHNLYRLEDQIIDQFYIEYEADIELGTRMGAAYCVTGATGQLPQTVAEPD
jgi:DNA repair exonuclease SbcCD ATPase subunit